MRVVGTTGSGSGFVVDAAGYILTNEHVVADQTRLTAVLDDGTRLTARVIGADAGRDIALLKVDASRRQLTVLTLATEVREGEEVVALGYPLNLGDRMTVTKGIVSALRTYGGVAHVQTDAAINPGNSGGPLLNSRGEVVGMNTRTRRDIPGRDFDAQGIGFAIKSDVLASRLALMMSGTQLTPTPTQQPRTDTSGDTFGPESGSLDHDPNDGVIPTFDSGVDLADFVAEATITTPHAIARSTWSSGFQIRRTGRNRGHMVFIHSSGAWFHYLRSGDHDDAKMLQTGSSPAIRTGRDVKNHVRVIASGDTGWLFVNGGYEAELNLSSSTDSGSVALLGSVFKGDELAGGSTPFSDFTVRPLRKAYGPRDGTVEHDPDDGFIDVHRTYTSLADGIIEARFFNPYSPEVGSWSSGFLVRQGVVNEFHAVVVHSYGRWFHGVRTGDVDTEKLADSTSAHISTNPSESNHIRIIALGAEGWLFINGAYVDMLDLSGRLEAGRVSAVGVYFTGHGIAGKSTRFEDLTIWSIGGAP